MRKSGLCALIAGLVGLTGLGYCQQATLYVHPETTAAAVNDTFVIRLNILNVRNLAAWQIGLVWDASVLGYKWVREGSFLRDSGSTWFLKSEDDTAQGSVLLGCVYLPLKCRSGSGNFAYCCFKVKRAASATFAIDDPDNTFLLDTNTVTIPCTIRNGYFRPRVAVDEGPAGLVRDQGIVCSPNPFAKTTLIRFLNADVSRRKDVSLTIYDAEGRRVRYFNNSVIPPSGSVCWDGRDDRGYDLPAGAYLGRFKTGNETRLLSILLVKWRL